MNEVVDEKLEKDLYKCPLYQTSKRSERNTSNFSDFITSILLPTKLHSEKWVLGGVAALCQTDE